MEQKCPKRHLTREDFRKWDLEELTAEEMDAFLSHTACCDTCAGRWSAYLMEESDALETPPAYLAEEIEQQSHRPDLQISRKIFQTSRQLQLLTYSLKITTAVVFSILMLFSIGITNQKTLFSAGPDTAYAYQFPKQQLNLSEQIQNQAETFTESLQNFSKSILNFTYNWTTNQED